MRDVEGDEPAGGDAAEDVLAAFAGAPSTEPPQAETWKRPVSEVLL